MARTIPKPTKSCIGTKVSVTAVKVATEATPNCIVWLCKSSRCSSNVVIVVCTDDAHDVVAVTSDGDEGASFDEDGTSCF
jgi:hypothetical protein